MKLLRHNTCILAAVIGLSGCGGGSGSMPMTDGMVVPPTTVAPVMPVSPEPSIPIFDEPKDADPLPPIAITPPVVVKPPPVVYKYETTDFTALHYWATPDFDSALKGFGYNTPQVPGGVSIFGARLNGFKSDGPGEGLIGTVTWAGIFAGINLATTNPSYGTVSASMDLTDTDKLSVEFNGDDLPTDEYTLGRPTNENRWLFVEPGFFINAYFFAAGGDPIGAAAGFLETPDVKGAWGAKRQ